jgi:peptidyl-prolyl cis-trans isomerase A (cyclophilin A)
VEPFHRHPPAIGQQPQFDGRSIGAERADCHTRLSVVSNLVRAEDRERIGARTPRDRLDDLSWEGRSDGHRTMMAHMTPVAKFRTSEGDFTVELFEDRAPATVANFIGLAEGTREWIDPRSGRPVTRPFYDGLIFHRVIDGFMIQGGCPLGTGTGGPGYRFADEFGPGLRHDRAGILSMANAGPDTNGSQFFITLAPTPWLDGKHAIFGEVVEGLDVIRRIGGTSTDQHDRPRRDIVIHSVTIERR